MHETEPTKGLNVPKNGDTKTEDGLDWVFEDGTWLVVQPKKPLINESTEIDRLMSKQNPTDVLLQHNNELLEALNESNGIAAISLLRIYDVLMCLYADKDLEDAQALIALHNNGQLRGKLPWLDLSSTGENDENNE